MIWNEKYEKLDGEAMAQLQLERLQATLNRAVRNVEASVAEAMLREHALTLCQVLIEQCPIELDVGDLTAAGTCIDVLIDESTRHGLTLCIAWGRCFRGALLSATGDHGTALQLLRTARDELRERGFGLRYTSMLGFLAKAEGAAGQTAEGLATIDNALTLCEQAEERWYIAELLRIKGELLIAENAANVTAAEEHFTRSLDWARRQGALSWELRAAISLGRLLHTRGEAKDARDLLSSVYARFAEGFETADLQSAKQLLDAWGVEPS